MFHILKILNSEQGSCGSFKQTNKIKFGAIKLFVLQFENGKLHCTIGTANFKRRIDQIKTDVFFPIKACKAHAVKLQGGD